MITNYQNKSRHSSLGDTLMVISYFKHIYSFVHLFHNTVSLSKHSNVSGSFCKKPYPNRIGIIESPNTILTKMKIT